jgi:hypothetical protein
MSEDELIDQINEAIHEFEEEHDLHLDEDAWDALGRAMEGGLSPEEAFAAAGLEVEDDDDDEVDEDGDYLGNQSGLPSSEEVDAWARAAIEEQVAAEVGRIARDYSLASETEAQEEFEESYHAAVESRERERGGRLTDREREAMWQKATELTADPAVESDSDVWKGAKAAVSDIDPGSYFDELSREADKEQAEHEAQEPEETQTPAEYLAEVEEAESEYREALDAAVRGERPSPVPEYQEQ